jgi:hypothetical protein
MGDSIRPPALGKKELETYLTQTAVHISPRDGDVLVSGAQAADDTIVITNAQGDEIQEIDFGAVELFGRDLPPESEIRIHNKGTGPCHIEFGERPEWCAVEPGTLDLSANDSARVELSVALESLKGCSPAERGAVIKVESSFGPSLLPVRLRVVGSGIQTKLTADRIELDSFPGTNSVTLHLPVESEGEGEIQGMIVDPRHRLCHRFRHRSADSTSPRRGTLVVTIPLEKSGHDSRDLGRGRALTGPWTVQVVFFNGPEMLSQLLTIDFPKRLTVDPSAAVLSSHRGAKCVMQIRGLQEGGEIQLRTVPRDLAVEVENHSRIVIRHAASKPTPGSSLLELYDSTSREEIVIPVLILESEEMWPS